MIHLYIPTGAMVRPRGSCNLLCKYHVLCSGVMMQDMYCSLLYIYNADSLLQFDLVILFLKFASIDSLCWNSRWFYQLMIVLILRLPILSNKCPLCSYFLLPLIDIRPYSEKTVYPETDWSNVRENDPQMLLYLGSLSVGRLEGGREGIRWSVWELLSHVGLRQSHRSYGKCPVGISPLKVPAAATAMSITRQMGSHYYPDTWWLSSPPSPHL